MISSNSSLLGVMQSLDAKMDRILDHQNSFSFIVLGHQDKLDTLRSDVTRIERELAAVHRRLEHLEGEAA